MANFLSSNLIFFPCFLLLGLYHCEQIPSETARQVSEEMVQIQVESFKKIEVYDYDEIEVELDAKVRSTVLIPTASVIEEVLVRPPKRVFKGQSLLRLKPLNPVMSNFVLTASESGQLASFDVRAGDELKANSAVGSIIDECIFQAEAYVPYKIISRLIQAQYTKNSIYSKLSASAEEKQISGDELFEKIKISGFSTRHEKNSGLYKIYLEAKLQESQKNKALPSFWTLSLESNYRELYAFKESVWRDNNLLFLDIENKLRIFRSEKPILFKKFKIPEQDQFKKFLEENKALKIISDFSKYPKEEHKFKIIDKKDE